MKERMDEKERCLEVFKRKEGESLQSCSCNMKLQQWKP